MKFWKSVFIFPDLCEDIFFKYRLSARFSNNKHAFLWTKERVNEKVEFILKNLCEASQEKHKKFPSLSGSKFLSNLNVLVPHRFCGSLQ